MKVQNVSICATEQAKAAGCPELTPELLAACGARYSRNNEGLQAILDKIDPNNTDKSVDGIFKMIDFGHQSIADLTPVAMFIDNISILLAYLVWSWCPTAGGQESSTRYIKLDRDGLVDPTLFGVPESEREEWYAFMSKCFDVYHSALNFWEDQVTANPSLANIPAKVMTDTSEKGQKIVARMKRNYAFDRSRYFLPVAALTNMMMVMSARGWTQLCQNLLSHWLPECNQLGEKIKSELTHSAPRMIKHAERKESFTKGHQFELNTLKSFARWYLQGESECVPNIELFLPDGTSEHCAVNALSFHNNRYAFTGSAVCRTAVRFSWSAVAIAEIRDFNRHRTGTKFCPLCPVGFYAAYDQVPYNKELSIDFTVLGNNATSNARSRLGHGRPDFTAWLLLGHQFRFEHTTTLDKFVYEAELRTGTGAHYRYAAHIRDVMALLGKSYPHLVECINLGTSEPE